MTRALILFATLILGACVTEGGTQRAANPQEAARLYTELGFGYLQQDRLDLAAEKFARALELQPQRPHALFGQGLMFYRQGKTTEGRRAVDQAARRVGSDSPLRNSIADWYCETADVAAARDVLATALRQAEADAVLRMGRCLRRNGRPQEAEQLVMDALAQAPDSGELLLGVAALDVGREDWVRARQFLQRYARIAPPTGQSAWLGLQVAIAFNDEAERSRQAQLLQRLNPDLARRINLQTGKPRNANES